MNAIVTMSDHRLMESPTVLTNSVVMIEVSKCQWSNVINYAEWERTVTRQHLRRCFIRAHKGLKPKQGWPSRHRPR